MNPAYYLNSNWKANQLFKNEHTCRFIRTLWMDEFEKKRILTLNIEDNEKISDKVYC